MKTTTKKNKYKRRFMKVTDSVCLKGDLKCSPPTSRANKMITCVCCVCVCLYFVDHGVAGSEGESECVEKREQMKAKEAQHCGP